VWLLCASREYRYGAEILENLKLPSTLIVVPLRGIVLLARPADICLVPLFHAQWQCICRKAKQSKYLSWMHIASAADGARVPLISIRADCVREATDIGAQIRQMTQGDC
jgi:hypothetical protein